MRNTDVKPAPSEVNSSFPDQVPAERGSRRRPTLRGRTVASLVFPGVFSAALVLSLQRATIDIVSPFDEPHHLANIGDVAEGHIPSRGNPLHEWDKQAFSCFPVASFGQVTTVPCGSDGPTDAYPEGRNTASGVWPPIYFIAAAVPVKAAVALGADPLMAARWFSAFLWAIGAAVRALPLPRLSAGRYQAVAIAVLTGAAPYRGRSTPTSPLTPPCCWSWPR